VISACTLLYSCWRDEMCFGHNKMFTRLFEAAGTLFNWMLRFVLLHIETPSLSKWEIYLFVERRAYEILRILQIKLRESGKEQDIKKHTTTYHIILGGSIQGNIFLMNSTISLSVPELAFVQYCTYRASCQADANKAAEALLQKRAERWCDRREAGTQLKGRDCNCKK